MTDNIAIGTDGIRMLLAGETIPVEPRAPGRYFVREMIRAADKGPQRWVYAAGGEPIEVPEQQIRDVLKWARGQKRSRIPASHMPRMFSRFTLIVYENGVAMVERVNIDRGWS